MSNRKEEILIVALHLFARDGYEAVSVSQIAYLVICLMNILQFASLQINRAVTF